MPGHGQSPGNPMELNVGTDGVGLFAIVLYYDSNGNGTFDANDQVAGLFYLAEVKVTATAVTGRESLTPFGTPADPNKNDTAGVTTITSFKEGKYAPPNGVYGMCEQANVTLVGGGADGTIGVNLIQTGWIGNVTGCTMFGDYGKGIAPEVSSLQPGAGNYPFIDLAPPVSC